MKHLRSASNYTHKNWSLAIYQDDYRGKFYLVIMNDTTGKRHSYVGGFTSLESLEHYLLGMGEKKNPTDNEALLAEICASILNQSRRHLSHV